MTTNINELVYALGKLNPGKLEELKKNNPMYESLLNPGVTLGEHDSDSKELLVKAEICIETNREVINKCETELPIIKKRIKNHKKLSLTAQIITAISSATVIGTLMSRYQNTILPVLFGLLGLIGSLIPIISEYLITGIDNKKINEAYSELVKAKVEIEAQNRELIYFVKANIYSEKISEIVNACNAKTYEIMSLLLLA